MVRLSEGWRYILLNGAKRLCAALGSILGRSPMLMCWGYGSIEASNAGNRQAGRAGGWV